MFFFLLPSSGVLKLDLTSSSSPLLPTGLSEQPAGLHALTVTMYWVDGVRPVITPEENREVGKTTLQIWNTICKLF